MSIVCQISIIKLESFVNMIFCVGGANAAAEALFLVGE